MSKQYDASEKSLNELLSTYTNIFVPPFQRPYKWTDEQIEELFEDIFKPIDWSKGIKTIAEDKESHYMGAVVLCSDVNGQMVLDGQQRLTTVTMVLAYLKAKMMVCAGGSVQLSRRALNYDSKLFRQTAGIDAARHPILKPQDEDNLIYQEIVESEELVIPLEEDSHGVSSVQKRRNKDLRKRAMFKAYKTIRKHVESYVVKAAMQHSVDELNALDVAATRLINNLSFVVIEAHNESAAFRLFETLNARGLDLSAADLIKNNLFAIARNDQQRQSVRESWEDVSESIKSDLVAFMRTFWLTKNDFVRKDGLFDAYKKELMARKTDDEFLTVFLSSLVVAAEHYAEIAQPQDDSDILKEANMLNDLGAKTCRPLLLVVKMNGPQLFVEVSKLIENLTVRWMIAGKVFNVLETAYARIAVRTTEAFAAGKTDQEVLGLIRSELRKLDVPDDAVFELAFQKFEVSRTSKALRHVLCRINDAISQTKEHIADSSNVHIEHIFPQEPSADALTHSGITAEEADDYSTRIGNVTLLDAKINMGLKNRSFPAKLNAEKGYIHSRLAINDSLKLKTSWLKADIEERSKFYAKHAVKIWPWI
jgi:uncharacterized protein with ParB-like and HNH nuclease domain